MLCGDRTKHHLAIIALDPRHPESGVQLAAINYRTNSPHLRI
jgi:hypothetical protein